MDIMEYLLLEMACILLSKKKLDAAHSTKETDKINANIADGEEMMLTCCSLENFYEAKGFYEGRIQKQKKKDLFGVATKDLLDYTEELIAKKKERER